MLFRLVTIIYFTVLCDSFTHPHIFVFDKKFDQHSSARVFGQSAPVPVKTLIRAKAIPQGTQYIQYPVLDADVASGATLKIE